MKWTLNKLIRKAEREEVSMAELGQRGGRKAASTFRQRNRYKQAAARTNGQVTWYNRED